MTVISTKSITGVTSITSPQSDDAVTLHTNDTTQRVSVTTGGMNVTGVVTATSFSGNITGTVTGTASGNQTLANGSNNRVITATGANALTGESSLTFDGTTLMNAGGTITAERGAIPSIEAKNSTDTSYARFYCSQTSGSGGYAAFQKLGTTSTAIGGANATQIWCTGDAPLVIGVNNAERLRITSTGKVGMGTAANNGPAAPLHIYGGSNTTPIIAFTRNTTHDDWQGAGIGMHDEGGTYKGALTFYTHSSSGTKNDSITEKVRIDSTGRLIVGSGTNTIINNFKVAIKETAGENAAIVFLDTDNMKGGICGIAKGTDQILVGTTNVDFLVGSSYADTHIISGNGSNSTGYIRATATIGGAFVVGHTDSRDVASTAFGRLQVHTGNSMVNTAIASYGNNAGGCILALGHSRHATTGSVGVAVQQNDYLGEIRFAGDDGTDMENTACQICGVVDGSVSSNSIPGRLEFWTGAKRLSITSGGHVRANQNGLKYSTDSSGWHQQIQGGATNPGGTIIFTGGNSTGDLKFYAQGTTSTLAQRMRIHSDGMLEYRNHGNSKTYCFSSGQSGGYTTCTIDIDAHAYHSFVIDVSFGGYAGKWGTARYMGYENGSIYYPNEGTESTDANARNITHSSISGHKHRIYIEGGIGTHPVVQLQITIGGPDAYIDTGDVSYTWA